MEGSQNTTSCHHAKNALPAIAPEHAPLLAKTLPVGFKAQLGICAHKIYAHEHVENVLVHFFVQQSG